MPGEYKGRDSANQRELFLDYCVDSLYTLLSEYLFAFEINLFFTYV